MIDVLTVRNGKALPAAAFVRSLNQSINRVAFIHCLKVFRRSNVDTREPEEPILTSCFCERTKSKWIKMMSSLSWYASEQGRGDVGATRT
mmetsp:Transcript_22878/g.33918  ORF Transcript_22878/g.33918 Transcript_22878/m.33918 type:complete len:90 (-) Transcript_22878:71-340(-)